MKPELQPPTSGRDICLSSHRTDLRELSTLRTCYQAGSAGGVYLEGGLEHIQGAVPMVLMTAIEQELELGDVERQVHLGDPAIGADHLAQPGPGAFHRIAVHLALAISIHVQRVLTSTVIHSPVLIAIAGQEVVDAIAVGVDLGPAPHHLIHERADGLRLHIAQHEQADLTATTQQSKGGQPIRIPGTASASFEPSLAQEDSIVDSFTLENAVAQIEEWFTDVELRRYTDSLVVTDEGALLDYVLSFSMVQNMPEDRKADLIEFIRQRFAGQGGVFSITKDSGMVLARSV